jgi:hypothetical protein
MPGLTSSQWDALTAGHSKTVIDSLAKKAWDDLKPDEQEALSLAGLTKEQWNSSNEGERKALLTDAQWNAFTVEQLKTLSDGLVKKTWTTLTTDEKNALGLSEEKQWTDLPIPQREALVEFTLLSDVLAAPQDGGELPTHRKWTLPHPDNKALGDKP